MAQPTSRERVLQNAARAQAAGRQQLAQQEAAQRTAPITGQAIGYDATTGDRVIATPSGGTMRATSISTGALVGRLPVQRFGDSQTAVVDSRGSRGDQSVVLNEIEAAQRDVVSFLIPEERTIGIQSPQVQQYPIVAVNDVPRLYLGLAIRNVNNDGTEAASGTATVLVDNVVAVAEETVISADAYVALNVTDPGEGDIMAVSVYARRV